MDEQHTEPISAPRWATALVIGGALLTVIIIAVIVLLAGDENSDEESPDLVEVTLAPNVTATPIPPTVTPTDIPVTPFAPPNLPTAAADVVGEHLLTPAGSSANVIVRDPNPYTVTGNITRASVQNYLVESGDTVSGIADNFGLDLCTLVWSNPRNRVSPLRPGAVLNILPVDGAYHQVDDPVTVAALGNLYGVDPFSIIDSPYNDLLGAEPNTVLAQDMKIVIPDGEGGDCNLWASIPTFSLGGDRDLWGCSYSPLAGAASYPAGSPLLDAFVVTQLFSATHSGIDMAAPAGTPIYAAGGGVVAFAGSTERGYGFAVVIDHSGSFSLYAHLNWLNVGCGQVVPAGFVLGGVGSTGNSTGNHLHFEIRDAGFNAVNPR